MARRVQQAQEFTRRLAQFAIGGAVGGGAITLYYRATQLSHPSGQDGSRQGSVFDILAPRYDDCIGKEVSRRLVYP